MTREKVRISVVLGALVALATVACQMEQLGVSVVPHAE